MQIVNPGDADAMRKIAQALQMAAYHPADADNRAAALLRELRAVGLGVVDVRGAAQRLREAIAVDIVRVED